MINQKYIETTKTARYYTLGKPSKYLTDVWFVFHGYGQLAKEFLELFTGVVNDKILFVAPEAMNKFYSRGFTGKIGTTWMTKEDRENEIKDYINMINNVYNEIYEIVDLTKVRINVLSFSQGGHTSVRWLSEKQPSVNRLILWGSGMPRDISYNANLGYWNKIKIKLVVGNKDQFITEEKLNEELSFLGEQKIIFELIRYNGSHQINTANLQLILNRKD
jgi:predicted esterase